MVWMPKEYEFKVKIHKTTDKKRLSTNETKNYDYGTINIRRPELAKHIGKMVKVRIEIK